MGSLESSWGFRESLIWHIFAKRACVSTLDLGLLEALMTLVLRRVSVWQPITPRKRLCCQHPSFLAFRSWTVEFCRRPNHLQRVGVHRVVIFHTRHSSPFYRLPVHTPGAYKTAELNDGNLPQQCQNWQFMSVSAAFKSPGQKVTPIRQSQLSIFKQDHFCLFWFWPNDEKHGLHTTWWLTNKHMQIKRKNSWVIFKTCDLEPVFLGTASDWQSLGNSHSKPRS